MRCFQVIQKKPPVSKPADGGPILTSMVRRIAELRLFWPGNIVVPAGF